ncbi:MAG: hypothetical protein EHM20_09715 [Alphaproteobacteria bacterium]|nr:MAG: hypothetical protein EHM20_09715 [Alphaproteobacteria bacterium]
MENERKSIPLNEFLSLMSLAAGRIVISTDEKISLEYDGFNIQAREFMKYAETDLEQGTTQGLVNALSNAKRAVDCQVDTVLGCFGLLSRRNFSEKIKALGQLGIVTPRIVSKVVRARNYLEHEFIKPTREQVEDAVDVAYLFISLLDYGIRNFYFAFGIEPPMDEKPNGAVSIEYDCERKQYKLEGEIYSEPPNPDMPEIILTTQAIIKPKEKGFFELVKLAFLLDKPNSESEIKQQAAQFLQLLGSRNP